MRLSEIQLLSDDLAETGRYYSGVLGLKKTHQKEGSVSFRVGASILTFLKSEAISPVYHFAFNIPPHQLMEALEWTRRRTAILQGEDGDEIADFVRWNAKAFYFKDNNGNILEFIARFDLDVTGDGPFVSDLIISISEIGIVIDDVVSVRESISEKYGVPIFSKPPILDNFTAMGDDNGLFILSRTGRHWHPTETAAQCYWSRIEFESNGVCYEMTS